MFYQKDPTTEDVLTFLTTFIEEHNYSPSIREIADGCYVSVGTVIRHLDKLEFAGEIVRIPGKARSIRFSDDASSPD